MKYVIQYTDKKGSHHTQTTTDPLVANKKVVLLFKQRIEAVVYGNSGEVIGRVWKDNSQRIAWNYSIKLQ